MEFMLDTANLDDIRHGLDVYPITGVTSNPSILKAEGNVPFFPHMREIRALIGLERSLHIQVIAQDAEGILREAEAIFAAIDTQVHIKIPTTGQGMKAMRLLKARGARVTATGIYTHLQGMMAIACGADYLAPYINRMEDLDIDAFETIASLRKMTDQDGAASKVLAASFKNAAQVTGALAAGAQAVTVAPGILDKAFSVPSIQQAVDNFHADWVSVRGDVSLVDLAE